MDPFTAFLLSSAPALLGPMLERGDPNSKRLKLLRQMLKNNPKLSPDAFFKEWQRSPAHSASMNALNIGANQASAAYASNVGRAGAENTGIAQAGAANLHMMPGVAFGQINAQAWRDAIERSMEARRDQLNEANIIGSMPQAPNYTAQLLGQGLQAWGSRFLTPSRTSGVPVAQANSANSRLVTAMTARPNYGRRAPARQPARGYY